MDNRGDKITHPLFLASFYGLAVFIPFSIAGANVSIMLGFLACIIAVVASPAARDRYRNALYDPMLLASVLLVVSALPSVFMSENVTRALSDWESYWLLLIYFLVAHNLESPRVRERTFWILFTTATISSLYALYQGVQGGYRPSSTLYTMTFAGIMYQLITVNSSVLLGRLRRARMSVLLGGGIVVQLAALLFTLTRGAWLALVVGLFTVALVLKRRRVLLFGVAVVIVATLFVAQSGTLRERAETIIDNIGNPTDKNIATRLVLWDISWEMIRTHPFLGVGMGDYTIEAERLLRERKVTTAVDSHNIYLQLLATRGIIGFVFFVFFWVVLFRMLFGVYRRVRDGDPFGAHFVAGTVAATVAVLVGALSENNIDDAEVFTCFMTLVGMARSFDRRDPLRSSQATGDGGADEPDRVRGEERH